MKTALALAAASLLALAAPVFAQSVGAPGAVGTQGQPTAHNPGTGRYYNAQGRNEHWRHGRGRGGFYEGRAAARDRDWRAPRHDRHLTTGRALNGDVNGNNHSRSNGQ